MYPAARRCLASQRPMLRLPPLSRSFTSSIVTGNSLATLHRSTELGAAEETQNIAVMDKLMKTFRERSDPAHQSVLPVRSKGLWSEALSKLTIPGQPEQTHGAAGAATRALEPRRMHDSYCEIVLPFSSSPEMLEDYTNASGGIRTGLLMEHLDSLAGSIAYKHVLGPDAAALPTNAGFYIVTASVERLDMLASLYPVRDMRLSGQVIHTGKSSMEVAVRMQALDKDGGEETIMLGRFCMVCRDAHTNRSTQVNPLVLETKEDHALYTIGEVHRQRRQTVANRSLGRVPPTSTEAEELHSLYLSHGQEDMSARLVGNVERVWLEDTRLEKTMVMFPQERNVHQKIFGGYLMRLAYELGFANSCLFTRGHVTFLSLDGISFARPVPIGSLLRLTSNVVHSSSSDDYPALVHVWVHADVVNLETGTEQRTNDFRFTWCRETGPPLKRIVVPRTYGDAMQWVEGRRALEMGSEIRKLRKR
ncbi:transporter [Ganoderma sinense ZZ0214-1]|uniref:Transporter n=1 Tax=Ganoderma sinense ZZ0214-1 TaxID=1077348 RepID=A0A2G8RWL0_9APHY|nr:transporter [Ganoderma sinense ZZ0214-1]